MNRCKLLLLFLASSLAHRFEALFQRNDLEEELQLFQKELLPHRSSLR